MSEVFVSYSQKDRDLVAPIAARLTELGVGVWFDRNLQAGERFGAVIRQKLKETKVVLTCWSQNAIDSEWVDSEADYARELGTYVPVLIATCTLLPPFNRIHTEDLSAWTGDPSAPTWLKVADRIALMVGRDSVAAAAHALAGDDKARYQFAQRFPDEALARKIWADAEKAHRERFDDRLVEARAVVASRLESERAAQEASLVLLSSDFEAWLEDERRGAARATFPDPVASVGASSAEKALRSQVAVLSKSLSQSMVKEQENAQEVDAARQETKRLSDDLELMRARAISQHKAAKFPRLSATLAALSVGAVTAISSVAIDRATSDAPGLRTQVVTLTQSLDRANVENNRLREQFDLKSKEAQSLGKDVIALRAAAPASTKQLADANAALASARSEISSLERRINAQGAQILSPQNRSDLPKPTAIPSGSIAALHAMSQIAINETSCSGDILYADAFLSKQQDWVGEPESGVTVGVNRLYMTISDPKASYKLFLARDLADITRICSNAILDETASEARIRVGIIFWKTNDYFYLYLLNAVDKTVDLLFYDNRKNDWSYLKIGKTASVTRDKKGSYKFDIRFIGPKVTLYINDSLSDEYTAANYPLFSSAGLYSEASSTAQVNFQNLVVLR